MTPHFFSTPNVRTYLNFLQFGIELTTVKWPGQPRSWGRRDFAIAAPLWFFAVIFLIIPIRWEFGHRHRYRAFLRRLRGRCSSCGYDLRATPERCPECGTIPRKNKLVAA